jgi:hypothetical protein
LDTEAVERVEVELDRLVEKRAHEAKDAERIEDLWKESTQRAREKWRRENAAAWYGHHVHMRELHSSLAAEHEARARALLGGGGA